MGGSKLHILLCVICDMSLFVGILCDTWSYGDVSFIRRESLDNEAVLKQVKSRSFVECCTECVSLDNCTGVAYRDGECSIIDVAAAEPSLVEAEDASDNYQLMSIYSTKPPPRAGISNNIYDNTRFFRKS